MKLTEEQLLKLQQNLKVGQCPNCGCKEEKILSPNEIHLVSLDIDAKNTVGLDNLGSYPVIMTACPKCGFISLFDRKLLCR
jgi:predicted RNA-binding Zn-ribbon protein involved in translation (DUF1610 family)